ncbi:homeodomain-like protein [Tanacetum coccineum]
MQMRTMHVVKTYEEVSQEVLSVHLEIKYQLVLKETEEYCDSTTSRMYTLPMFWMLCFRYFVESLDYNIQLLSSIRFPCIVTITVPLRSATIMSSTPGPRTLTFDTIIFESKIGMMIPLDSHYPAGRNVYIRDLVDLVSVEVLRYDIKRSKSENKGIVPTEMNLVLEQTKQGTSHEVLCYERYHSEDGNPARANIKQALGRTVKYPKGIAENVLVGIGKFTFPVDFIILDMPEDIKVPLILGRPFLSTARAKIDVYKRKITLRVGEERIIFKSVKPASSLIKRVYMLSLRERMELDLEARLMGETLVLNRSLDPFLEDYIELNDLNEPFELRRNQGDDLMPTIEKGEVIEEFRTRDEDLDIGIDDYPSYYDDDKKIHIDCAHNIKFSCMIGFEFTHVNFYPLLYVNVMSKEFHNSIMKDKMVYKGDNVVGALMNVPIFLGTFSVMTDFAVLEDMDAYRDEGIGDIIVGEPFLREVGIKIKHLEGIITLYNGDDEVTYQMVRSHPRFKNHTNEQCNKIPPLLKVSEKDVKNGISHAYQKLKGFHKGVLNLGLDYIRNAKTEEWLTRGHISVHEMK